MPALLQPSNFDNLVNEVRVPVMSFEVPHQVVVLAQGWPCWLPSLLWLRIPVMDAFFPGKFHALFDGSRVWKTAHDFETMHYTKAVLLGSGSRTFWASQFVPAIRRLTSGCAMFCVETPFDSVRSRSVLRLWRKMVGEAGAEHCMVTTVRHADFGGATSGHHLVICWGIPVKAAFVPPPSTPRVLKHLVEAATMGSFHAIAAPAPLDPAPSRSVLVSDGLLRCEGLYDVSEPSRLVACPSVFARTGWVKRLLSRKELLRLFDLPTSMDGVLLNQPQSLEFVNGLSPLVVTSVFRTLWGKVEGGRNRSQHQVATPRPSPMKVADRLEGGVQDKVVESKVQEDMFMSEDGKAVIRVQEDRNRSEDGKVAIGAEAMVDEMAGCEEPFDALLDLVKQARDLAKAVKSDDAEVPVHLWNEKVCRRSPTTTEASALDKIRAVMTQKFRRLLCEDCLEWMRAKHGVRWWDKMASNQMVRMERELLADVVWRAANNSWFEYPSGSRLHYFRFPTRYRVLARDGVPPYFLNDLLPSPLSIRLKPPPPEEERTILAKKITTIIAKRYIVPPKEKLRSCIQYFAVPKGIIDGVTQDWRVVYHAGANKLNDCVWAPGFWLPTVSSLLRMLDSGSLMEDRDIGEMFLNFELHPSLRKFAGVDVSSLSLDREVTDGHRWFYWTKNLMGFRPSPYNSVKMYLIAEEVIRGDRHDACNAFQWSSVILNLPGSATYCPSKPWLYKIRQDGSMASDFISFMDDQRICASGENRVNEAGHTLSTREAYLGIHDALRKWRAAGGTRRPGAWAGTVVYNDEDLGITVLTSQEKWDRVKSICKKWLTAIEEGAIDGNHKEMQSDRGFLVYVGQAYPAMKPYLKGFHLSLEMWRGGRDREGWKLKKHGLPEMVENDEEDGLEETLQ